MSKETSEMTVPEVAKLLGVDFHEIYHLKRHHGLPGYKHGNRMFFSRNLVATWMVDVFPNLRKEDFSAVKKVT